MNGEMNDLWDAMKTAKYDSTHDDIQKIIDRNYEDASRTVSLCLDAVCKAVHAAAGSFWFYDKYGMDEIRSLAQFGGSDLGAIRLKPGTGICGKVIETGKPIIVAKVERDADWRKDVDKNTGYNTKTMICVPLKASDITFGCIQILNKIDDTAFDEKDLSLANSLAQEVSDLFESNDILRNYGYNDPRAALEFVIDECVCLGTDEEAVRMIKACVIYGKVGFFKRIALVNKVINLRHHVDWITRNVRL